mgnify:CR=1 FL=1
MNHTIIKLFLLVIGVNMLESRNSVKYVIIFLIHLKYIYSKVSASNTKRLFKTVENRPLMLSYEIRLSCPKLSNAYINFLISMRSTTFLTFAICFPFPTIENLIELFEVPSKAFTFNWSMI